MAVYPALFYNMIDMMKTKLFISIIGKNRSRKVERFLGDQRFLGFLFHFGARGFEKAAPFADVVLIMIDDVVSIDEFRLEFDAPKIAGHPLFLRLVNAHVFNRVVRL